MAPVTPVNGSNGHNTGTPAEPPKTLRRNWELAWVTLAFLVLACGTLVGFKVSGLGAHIFGSQSAIQSLAAEAVGTAYRLHGYQNALRVLAVQLEAESQHAYIPN